MVTPFNVKFIIRKPHHAWSWGGKASHFHRIHFHTKLVSVRAEKMPCESTCHLMMYHSDISLWSTADPHPSSGLGSAFLPSDFNDWSHEVVPRALASGPYPGSPHNSSYFSTSLQSSMLYRIWEIVPGAGREMQLAPDRVRAETHGNAEKGHHSLDYNFTDLPASFRPLTRMKTGQEETMSAHISVLQHTTVSVNQRTHLDERLTEQLSQL